MSMTGNIEEFMFEGINFNAKQILDAGTGKGLFTTRLVQLVGKAKGNRKIISIDMDAEKFKNVTARLKGNQKKYIEFIKADLASLSFIEDNTFDIIFCHHIIHIINTRPLKATQALYEFNRVLKTHGTLIINENYPINGAHSEEYKIFSELKRLKTILYIYLNKQLSPRIYPEDIAYILKKIGFEKTNIKAFKDQTFHIKLFDHFFNEIKVEVQRIEDTFLKTFFENRLNTIRQTYKTTPGTIPPQYVIKLTK
ncbi:methyltransferase domain-containing protein [Candidatus Dependentiae bacterium]|nr:methyltransferase domain-containing protein [Candidatus Dependentiae bacterium]